MDKAKRGYQEKKQLLLKHAQTEKTLTNQAKQLMDVANVVTKDVNKLHETISRRKYYEQNNREACNNLDSNLNASFNLLSNNNSAYKSALIDQTSSLIGKMSELYLGSFVFKFRQLHAYNNVHGIFFFFCCFRYQYKAK